MLIAFTYISFLKYICIYKYINIYIYIYRERERERETERERQRVLNKREQ